MTEDKAETLAREYHEILKYFILGMMVEGHRPDNIGKAMLIFGAELTRDTCGLPHTLEVLYRVEAALTAPKP